MTRARSFPRIALIAATAVATITATGCGSIQWPGGGTTALTASVTLEAEETMIAPRVSGEIVALPVAAGSPVAKGEVVAQIDDRAVQLQLRQPPDSATRETYQLQA